MGRRLTTVAACAFVALGLAVGCGREDTAQVGSAERPRTMVRQSTQPVTTEQDDSQVAKRARFGPPATATQPDLPGNYEHSKAMALLGKLVAENPTARSVIITATVQSTIEKKTYHLRWEYDRERRRFVYRQKDKTTGVTEYQYSKVRDDILTDIGKRAANEFVDWSEVHAYGCPYELVRNGKVTFTEP